MFLITTAEKKVEKWQKLAMYYRLTDCIKKI